MFHPYQLKVILVTFLQRFKRRHDIIDVAFKENCLAFNIGIIKRHHFDKHKANFLQCFPIIILYIVHMLVSNFFGCAINIPAF